MAPRFLVLLFLSLTFLFSIIASDDLRLSAPPTELRKQLAGPPSEFQSMLIPDPSTASLRADSCLIPFTLSLKSPNLYTWTFDYPVDTPEQITVTVLSPFKDQLTFYLLSPTDTEYRKIDKTLFEGPLSLGKSYFSSSFGIDGNVVPAHSYVFFNPPVGMWSIQIESTQKLAPPAGYPAGYLLLDNISPYKLVSQLTTYNLDVGEDVGVTVHMVHETVHDITGEVISESVLPTSIVNSAKLTVLLPDGKEVIIPMHDDGMGADVMANDGYYTGTIHAAQAGDYVFQPMIGGVVPDSNLKFLRSVSHLVAVSQPEVTLTGLAYSTFDTKEKIVTFEINVDLLNSNPDTVRAYAEVWGSQKSNFVAVAWIEAMVDVKKSAKHGINVVELQLNEQWVVKAGGVGSFELRNVVIQNRETNSVMSEKKVISVLASDASMTKLKGGKAFPKGESVEITEEMRYGKRPVKYAARNESVSVAGGKLVLVHGYCSGDVWDNTHFTDAIKFEDYSKSRSQDQFALLIRKFAEEANGLTSFGIVAHSQGGLAALHLKAYYWSGLDVATGGRIIQSVGSPYKGCSLAGTLADLGGLFGVGCSSNSDLAPNGAQLWLSKVPKDPQDKVFYYTTQYDDSWFLSPACVTASGLVLYSPNDGTCEIKFSQPDKGGNNLGTKKSFCHITGMNYPPQTKDTTRNAEMNKNAAR